ncbi:LOW QUALITY PROTEIN: uncharacterized protein LOC129742347 [Uranotaenia lowii]|uniref:LOW QUALITY PROTEIN: uncharacterized protein LOC129742347 n=1 Tax=Uranotaenia lowii TaxID=190385 RepID=UPI002478919F|nr:LOW QUALITY PROTEIN: uncharacterized protein LOC129742347 [Uranotaenia lowii]
MNLNEVVYVGNVPKQSTDSELIEFFKDVGTVIKVSFMRENRNDCRSKVGFVLFENEMQALKACSFDQTIFQWNRVIVMLVNDERHFLAGHTVAVYNISSETNEEDLYEACGRYGMIEAVQIPTSNFAYVGFKEKSAAVAAQRLNNTNIGKSRVKISIMTRNVRVRLEDLDSFKTPRVYNELMDAKIKYNRHRQPTVMAPTSTAMFYDDDEEDSEDDRIYDPITNQFYDKPKPSMDKQKSMAYDDYDDIAFVPPPAPSTSVWPSQNLAPTTSIDLVSPNQSPTRDSFDSHNEDLESAPGEIPRRLVEFVNTGIVPISKAAVKVENIPRDVYDEDVVKYFDEFGPLLSVEIENSTTCMFNKVYTVVYKNESSAEKLLQIFMRKCEFSGVVCTIFTTRPNETLQEVPGKCVIIDYLSSSAVFEDVVDAFREAGEVIYVKKTYRNNTPTVVFFQNTVSMKRAQIVTKIDGDKVKVVPYGQEAYRKYTTENAALKKASVSYTKKPLKNVRMMDIEMKEQNEKSKYVIMKTVYNPNYGNPDPDKYENEVVIYNCPTRTTLKDLRRHFINIAFVTNMRFEQNLFDTNTWKVYASFGSFMEAFNAVRMKSNFQTYPVFKHLASEKPKLDTLESIQIECEIDDISVSRMHQSLVSIGAITFVDKTSHKDFVAICRESKTAKKLVQVKTLARSPCKVTMYRNLLNDQNNATFEESSKKQNKPGNMTVQHVAKSGGDLPVPMNELLAMQKKIIDDDFGNHRKNSRLDNEWEQETRTVTYRRHSVDMELADDDDLNSQKNVQFNTGSIAIRNDLHIPTREDALVYSNPPPPSMVSLGMIPYAPGWAPGGPMHMPMMVPAPITSVPHVSVVPTAYTDTIRPPGTFNEHSIRSSTSKIIQPDPPGHNPVPLQGDLRDYLAEKRNNTKPGIDDLDRQIDNIKASQSKSPREIHRLEEYIRDKEREIERRLHLLDKKLANNSGRRSRSRSRSKGPRAMSPGDVRFYNRLEQIKQEKIATSDALKTLRKKRNRYEKTANFVQLCSQFSALDQEYKQIQQQLVAKQLWLQERERSLSRERHDKDNRENSSKPTEKRGSRRTRFASRSSSRGRHRSISSERDYRDRRSRPSRWGRSTSREFSRKNNRGRSSSPNHRPVCNRRPESLMREMRQLGSPREGKADHAVFIGNIAVAVKDADLKGTFERYGRITSIDFSMREKYCEVYINYHQREDAFKALEMNGVRMCGKRLRVALNCRKPANRQGYSVIVEVPGHITERELEQKFSTCGDIEFIWHYANSTIATVTFGRPESMLKALVIRELHNRIPVIVREYVESER